MFPFEEFAHCCHVRLRWLWGCIAGRCVRNFCWRRKWFIWHWLLGCDQSHAPRTVRVAVQLSTAVLASTLHAQDFKDVSGDRLTGRCTLPIIFPFGARLSVALGIPLWSICLSRVWRLDPLSASAFVLYSAYTGVRFCFTGPSATTSDPANFIV